LHNFASSTHAAPIAGANPVVIPTTLPASSQQSFHQRFAGTGVRTVILGTANLLIHFNNSVWPARALLDSGSEVSFITASLRQRIGLSCTSTNISLLGVSAQVTATSSKLCSFAISPLNDKNMRVNCSAFVLPRISGNLPSITVDWQDNITLPSIDLADKHFYQSASVDLLLGADLYPHIIRAGVKHNVLGSLLAQQTLFGWVITGCLKPNPQPRPSATVYLTSTSVDEQLSRFWELEELPKKKYMSSEDKFC
jgi:hypothetical protein